MAALRASSVLFRRQQKDGIQGFSRNLHLLLLSSLKSSDVVSGGCWELERGSERESRSTENGPFRSVIRMLNTSATESQLETDLLSETTPLSIASKPAAAPVRSHSSVISGFSFLSHPAAELSLGLGSSSNAGRLSLDQLSIEMSSCLSLGRAEETVQLFEDWIKFFTLDQKPRIPNRTVYNLLLHAKLQLGVLPSNMVQIVKDMEMNGVKPNLITFNFLLRSTFRHRDSEMAEEVLRRMQESGSDVKPDNDSYNFVIVLCALDRRLDAALEHLKAMYASGYAPSKTTYGELLLAAIRLLRTRVAVSLLRDMKERGVYIQSANLVELATCAAEVDDSECINLALDYLTDTEFSKPVRDALMDEGSLQYILGCAARTADRELSRKAWSFLSTTLKGQGVPRPSSYLAHIHALSAAGDLDGAFSALCAMEETYGKSEDLDHEIFSPFTSLRPLVLACSRGGAASLDTVYYKLDETHSGGKVVSLAAVNCVIQGCANIWDYTRAYQTFEAVGVTFGLVPDVHSCNSLLDVFGKNGKMAEVLQIRNYMQEVAIEPNFQSFNLLINAHVVNRDVKLAIATIDEMVKAGHTPPKPTIVNVQRRCVREGNLEDSRQMTILLQKHGGLDNAHVKQRWAEIMQICGY